MDKKTSFHIDIDSPKSLLEFWGIKTKLDEHLLDKFYKSSMERVLELFHNCGIKASFFVVGEELKKSSIARDFIKKAYIDGHEIANHTFSHPLGFTNFEKKEITNEIVECSKIIKEITGVVPVGFRSPGYDMNSLILDVLEELSFLYDSSAFYTILKPFIKCYHNIFRKGLVYNGFGGSSNKLPDHPYYPSSADWQESGPARGIVEVPLARSRFNLPFYNNFHLLSGNLYRKTAISSMRNDYFVYLFHLIEFVDLHDEGVPKELKVHPNINVDVKKKLMIMKDTITRISKNYRIVKTLDFLKDVKQEI